MTKLLPLFSALIFAFAHTQSGLYYSNQNQYFLHGAAHAGTGDLAHDWLAKTTDPTVLFSALVTLGQRLGEPFIQAIFFVLLMVYFLSLISIARVLPRSPQSDAGRLAFYTLIILIHSAPFRVLSVKLFGVDYPWYSQCGVANQYLLGPGLQPSVFGVLLLTSIACFVHARHRTAALLIAAACTFHSTYLLTGAFLVIGMMIASPRRDAGIIGTLALLGVLPVIAYNAVAFQSQLPSNLHHSALDIIAWTRIPHHTDIRRWLDIVAILQLLAILASIIFIRKTNLGIVLMVSTLCSLLPTIVISFTGQDYTTLALLFPWRISTVLMPLATTIFLAAIVNCIEQYVKPRVLSLTTCIFLPITIISTFAVYVLHLGYQETTAEERLIHQVAATRQPGDLYLLPTNFPKPSTVRGSWSSTFLPLPVTDRPTVFELQRFRLGSGACVYVDFKSIPYRDDEVLEWDRRVRNCEKWYQSLDLPAIRSEGITHIVLPADSKLTSEEWEMMYADKAYRIMKLKVR